MREEKQQGTWMNMIKVQDILTINCLYEAQNHVQCLRSS